MYDGIAQWGSSCGSHRPVGSRYIPADLSHYDQKRLERVSREERAIIKAGAKVALTLIF